jgi:hypothetical protein
MAVLPGLTTRFSPVRNPETTAGAPAKLPWDTTGSTAASAAAARAAGVPLLCALGGRGDHTPVLRASLTRARRSCPSRCMNSPCDEATSRASIECSSRSCSARSERTRQVEAHSRRCSSARSASTTACGPLGLGATGGGGGAWRRWRPLSLIGGWAQTPPVCLRRQGPRRAQQRLTTNGQVFS